MPYLPQIEVTTEQGARLMAAFDGQTDDQGNAITPQDAYRRWVKENLRIYVIAHETRELDMQHNDARAQAIADAEASLP